MSTKAVAAVYGARARGNKQCPPVVLLQQARCLLRLEVTLGEEKRQIVAGIGEHYTPEEMVGKQVVMVTNLKPAIIRGVRSEGMLLAAMEEGRPVVLQPEKSVSPGSQVG